MRKNKKSSNLFTKLSSNFIVKQIFLLIIMYIFFESLIIIIGAINETGYFLMGIYFFIFFLDFNSFIISLLLSIIYYFVHNVLTYRNSFRMFRYNLTYLFLVNFIFLVFWFPLVKGGADLVSNFLGNNEGSFLLFELVALLVFSIISFVVIESFLVWLFRKFSK